MNGVRSREYIYAVRFFNVGRTPLIGKIEMIMRQLHRVTN